MGLKCKNHPDKDAYTYCTECGEPFCSDCLYEIGGKYYCNDHGPYGRLTPAPKPVADEGNNESGKLTPPPKCRSIFVGLALLLGPTGAHFFYSGSTHGGVIMFLVSVLLNVIGLGTGFSFLPLAIMEIVAIFQAGFITSDGYGRPFV